MSKNHIFRSILGDLQLFNFFYDLVAVKGPPCMVKFCFHCAYFLKLLFTFYCLNGNKNHLPLTPMFEDYN
jgi:hypothetical protein